MLMVIGYLIWLALYGWVKLDQRLWQVTPPFLALWLPRGGFGIAVATLVMATFLDRRAKRHRG
jgi:hypothetical protein